MPVSAYWSAPLSNISKSPFHQKADLADIPLHKVDKICLNIQEIHFQYGISGPDRFRLKFARLHPDPLETQSPAFLTRHIHIIYFPVFL